MMMWHGLGEGNWNGIKIKIPTVVHGRVHNQYGVVTIYNESFSMERDQEYALSIKGRGSSDRYGIMIGYGIGK